MTQEPKTARDIVRALMPFVEGAIAGAVAKVGWHITPEVAGEIAGLVAAGLSVVLRVAETLVPWLGAFLGWAGRPSFPPSEKASLSAQIAQLEAEVASLRANATQSSTPTPASPTGPSSGL